MPSSFPFVNMFSSTDEFGSLRGGVGRGILQTRVPREGCWGPDGVTRDGGMKSGGVGRELDLFIFQTVGEPSSG